MAEDQKPEERLRVCVCVCVVVCVYVSVCVCSGMDVSISTCMNRSGSMFPQVNSSFISFFKAQKTKPNQKKLLLLFTRWPSKMDVTCNFNFFWGFVLFI